MAVSALVDDREPPAVAAALRSHADVDAVEVRRLAAGDIVIRNVGFERKTSDDYLQSTIGRVGSDLEAQVRQMNETYDHAYVLIEGDLREVESRRPGVPDASVRGTVASITARLGTPVIPCGDGKRLADVAVRLARKHTEEPSARALSTGAVTSRTEPVAKRMYGCIDGVGPGTADALYETFPSVESLVAATEEELLAVEGVGPKRAAAIYEAFRREG
ncbi:helix-hairpin-helix domain-containing protein [Halostella sp. PRR32]|uniref:helix-hairpin-helix domain-containing protein n=1 Tax=Halostella sp. PRR32 TaxID=3098147 RepID=UPI002B1E6669|nr:helix-hairpin-helix domain-containing protein [Halostella sp. PRR32]